MNNIKQQLDSHRTNQKSQSTWGQLLPAISAFTIFAVTSVVCHASQAEMLAAKELSFWSLESLFAIFWLPIVILVLYSLILNKKKGWGWVVVGTGIVAVLALAQFAWWVITAFRGDPADDEDYFRPMENWYSDSF